MATDATTTKNERIADKVFKNVTRNYFVYELEMVCVHVFSIRLCSFKVVNRNMDEKKRNVNMMHETKYVKMLSTNLKMINFSFKVAFPHFAGQIL